MDLAINETQQMLKNSAREFFARECPLSLVRAMEEHPKGYTDELWQGMVDLGWLGLALPEKYGGAGGDLMDVAALLEEMGRALMPGPFFSTVVLGAMTILDAADEDNKEKLLSQIANGQLIVTLALTEINGTYDPEGIQVSACVDRNGYVINGTKLFVPDAQASDLLIVATRTSQTFNPKEGVTLLLVPKGTDGVSITPHETLPSGAQGEVRFDEVRLPFSAALGGIDMGWPIIERTLRRASAAKCVEMVGGAQAVLDMTLKYLKYRAQFGRPLGAFQSLQHHCANMATDVEGCRYTAYQAIWKVAQSAPATREVAIAKAWVSDAYIRVCGLAHQCHGAIGFTKEHDLQMYTHRARIQEQAFGDAQVHRKVLSNNLGDLKYPGRTES